jgi:hypothetical protein
VHLRGGSDATTHVVNGIGLISTVNKGLEQELALDGDERALQAVSRSRRVIPHPKNEAAGRPEFGCGACPNLPPIASTTSGGSCVTWFV